MRRRSLLLGAVAGLLPINAEAEQNHPWVQEEDASIKVGGKFYRVYESGWMECGDAVPHWTHFSSLKIEPYEPDGVNGSDMERRVVAIREADYAKGDICRQRLAYADAWLAERGHTWDSAEWEAHETWMLAMTLGVRPHDLYKESLHQQAWQAARAAYPG
jgi:hypothetical protein